MKTGYRIIFTAIIFCIGNTAYAQQRTIPPGTFYIVRHGEKDTGANPALSEAGRLRAGDLYRELAGKKIGAILVTKYRRSAMTADSLAAYQKIPMLLYAADTTGNGLAEAIMALPEGTGNVLIVGHSNTLPALVRKLGAPFTGTAIPDEEYDHLFIIERKNGMADLVSRRYGKSSNPRPLQ